MDFLLDTCTFLWIVSGDPRLSERAASVFMDPENHIFLSSVCCWEIAVKTRLGQLELPADPSEFIPEQRERHGIAPLALNEGAALVSARLPDIHPDPFDRMLICQALEGGYTLITPDHAFRRYPVRVLW